MRMIQEPTFFDVMVTENTFGDILTDEGSVISGSMGLLPSASTGESTPVFEPIHGSWPQAKGLNIANQKGLAIMIGHIWSANTLPNLLMELYPVLVKKGYRFTTVSKSGGLITP